ncbi:MAG: hypothetical protein LBI17_01670 [Rickettsiales bacterium]|jgi:hypothetical protein|nr:hypothetical protein [Rickettsiales bacterium]
MGFVRKWALLTVVFLSGFSGPAFPFDYKPSEFYGLWNFDGYEYNDGITTNCENTADTYRKDSHVVIGPAYFETVNPHSDGQVRIIHNGKFVGIAIELFEDGAYRLNAHTGPYDMERFYIVSENRIYMDIDGCKFFYARHR